MASSLSSAAAAAAASPALLPTTSPSTPLPTSLSAIQGRNWKIVDPDGREVPQELVKQAIQEEEIKLLTPEARRFLELINSNLASLTIRKCAKLFTNTDLKNKNPAYDAPLLCPGFSEEKTRAFALHFFGLGCDPAKKNEWMDCFAEKSGYTVANYSATVGKKKIREHLEGMFKGSPPLKYPMQLLLVRDNMTVALLINELNDKRGFPLFSLNFFNPNGKCILNGDFYNLPGAAGEVIRDLVTVPKDGVQVLEQQASGCKIQ